MIWPALLLVLHEVSWLAIRGCDATCGLSREAGCLYIMMVGYSS